MNDLLAVTIIKINAPYYIYLITLHIGAYVITLMILDKCITYNIFVHPMSYISYTNMYNIVKYMLNSRDFPITIGETKTVELDNEPPNTGSSIVGSYQGYLGAERRGGSQV